MENTEEINLLMVEYEENVKIRFEIYFFKGFSLMW
jgi:hypothetical protein